MGYGEELEKYLKKREENIKHLMEKFSEDKEALDVLLKSNEQYAENLDKILKRYDELQKKGLSDEEFSKEFEVIEKDRIALENQILDEEEAIVEEVNRRNKKEIEEKQKEIANLEKQVRYLLKQNDRLDAGRKLYPNDPCPCGSGKKYKKCCGSATRNIYESVE